MLSFWIYYNIRQRTKKAKNLNLDSLLNLTNFHLFKRGFVLV
jgi:hypothetical protein